ncbi:MAG: hypothetical protein HYX94_06905 [Chloroflexi bacterium]|nr:hypothetical protein [Chloroflexota bacterium]
MGGSTILIRSPIGQPRTLNLKLAPRPESLEGLTVGLLSNGWWSFNVVQQRFGELLKERCGVADVHFLDFRAATMEEGGGSGTWRIASGAESHFIERLAAKCDVVINGLGN